MTTNTDAVHDICILSVAFLHRKDSESQEIGNSLSDIAEALAFNNLELLQVRMEKAGTETRDLIPDDAFEFIAELGGCNLSPTQYR